MYLFGGDVDGYLANDVQTQGLQPGACLLGGAVCCCAVYCALRGVLCGVVGVRCVRCGGGAVSSPTMCTRKGSKPAPA